MNKLTSGKLQDIEANIKNLETEGKLAYLYHKIAFLNWRYTRKEWIKILEFERKQEIEYLKFMEKLNKHNKGGKTKNGNI